MNNRFKELMNKTKKIYGDAFGTYPVTMVMIIITTLLACIYYVVFEGSHSYDSYNTLGDKLLEWYLLFFIYGTVGFFGVEAFVKKLFEKNGRVKKIIGFAIIALLSCFLVSVNIERNCFGSKNVFLKDISYNYLFAWNMAYFVSVILVVFYCRYKESNQSIAKFFVSVFTQIVQLLIVWGILALGFLILSLIYEELIADFKGVYAIPQILIIGLYVAPRFLMAMTDFKEEIGRFFEALIKYALLVLTIFGAIIIYLYIIKVLFTGIPSNEIFGITTGLFFAAIPVGFACTAFPRDTFLQKIAYVLPYIYAPFIILQCYSLFVRIREYGTTPSRYMGIVLIVLEIIYTAVYAFKREHIDKIVLVMMAATIVVCLVPKVNVNAVSIASQRRIIVNALKEGLPLDYNGKRTVYRAYEYLVGEYGEDCIDRFLSPGDKEKIENMEGLEDITNSVVYYGLADTDGVFSTNGFDYFTTFSSYNYENEGEIGLEDLYIIVDSYEMGPFDMTEAYNTLKEKSMGSDAGYLFQYEEVDISDDCRMILTSENIREEKDTGRILEYTFNGYILFKESYFDKHPEDRTIFQKNK